MIILFRFLNLLFYGELLVTGIFDFKYLFIFKFFEQVIVPGFSHKS